MLRTLLASCTLALSASGLAYAQYGGPCQVSDNGSGTVDLPPMGCGYLSPDNFHVIVNGLPAGTTINIGPEHERFFCNPPMGPCEMPGGTLGGTIDSFTSTLAVTMQGTNTLSGFSRVIDIPLLCEVHTGPRTPNQPVQTFPADFFILQGGISSDPDFTLLNITGGTGLGMPSPGSTTLTRLGPAGSDFAVDSFFDIFYQIDFIGSPTGALAGMAGSTTGTIRMEAYGPTSFTSFCDASDGSLASCPCGNPGNPDSGCDIQQGTGGVKLTVLTQQTTPQNRSTMEGTGFPTTATPSAVVIRAPGLDAGTPVVFGDGLRCISQPLVRLAGALATGGTSSHVVGHGAMAPAGPGTFYYQLWFRNQPAMFCDPAAAYNLSNGRTITW